MLLNGNFKWVSTYLETSLCLIQKSRNDSTLKATRGVATHRPIISLQYHRVTSQLNRLSETPLLPRFVTW